MKRILKLVLGTMAALFLFCIVGSIYGSRDREKQVAAAQAAAEKKASEHAKAVAALDPNLTGDQLVAACVGTKKAGGIPTEHAGRCGDALLGAGQAALAAKRPADAVPLLEEAVKTATKKDEAQAALKDAKVAVATETATAELKRAETAWAAKDYAKATAAARAAQQAATEGLREKPDDATLKGLATKIDPVFRRADERATVAALVGDEEFEFKGGALVVTHETSVAPLELSQVIVDGQQTLMNLAATGFEQIPALQSITVIEFATYNDVKGNEARTKVGEFMVTRKKAKGVNWASITSRNTLKVIDKAWISPSVSGFAE